MVSVARRSFSFFFGLWFAVASVLVPVSATAAIAQGVVASLSSGVRFFAAAASVAQTAAAVLSPPAWAISVAGLGLGLAIGAAMLHTDKGDVVLLTKGTALAVEAASFGTTPTTYAAGGPATEYGHDALGWFTSVAAACTAGCQFQHTWASGGSQCLSYTSGNCYGTLVNGQTNAQYWAADQRTSAATCPNGGTLSGTQCIDVCPSGQSVYPDGKCHLTASSASGALPQDRGFVTPGGDGSTLRDLDGAAASPNVASRPIPVADAGTDAKGLPKQTVQVSPRSDGGYRVIEKTFDEATGRTTERSVTVSPNGVVVSTTTSEGTGNTTMIGGSSSEFSVDLPDDYNRESTQADIAKTLDDTKTGREAAAHPDFAQDVTDQKAAVDATIKTEVDKVPVDYPASKSMWFSWVWTPSVGNCQPWSNVVHGRTVSWNVCPYVDKIRDVIGFLFAIGGTWMVYNELFRRED